MQGAADMAMAMQTALKSGNSKSSREASNDEFSIVIPPLDLSSLSYQDSMTDSGSSRTLSDVVEQNDSDQRTETRAGLQEELKVRVLHS